MVALLTVVTRNCSMDYIVLSALISVTLLHIIITYDIACQWSKNFKKRMLEFPEDMRIGADVKMTLRFPAGI